MDVGGMGQREIQPEARGPKPEARRAQRGERGIALILCLLLLSILIILVTQFALSVKVDETIARNSSDEVKALFGARGAVAYVRAFLREDRKKWKGKVDSLRHDWAGEKLQSVTVGDSAVTIKLEDAERRFNVNLAADEATKAFALSTLTHLATKLNIEAPDELAQRIVDFINPAKDAKYAKGAKAAPLDFVEELYGMLGPDGNAIDPAAFLAQPGTGATTAGGTSAGAAKGQGTSGLQTSQSLAAAQATQSKQPGQQGQGDPALQNLLDFLTVWGTKKININTMSLEVAWAIIPDTVGGQPFDSGKKDDAVSQIDQLRTGADQNQSGTGTSPSGTKGTTTGTGSGSGTGSGTGTTGTGDDKPGIDFDTVDMLAQKVTALAPALAAAGQRTGQPPPPQPPAGTKPANTPAAPALRDMLSVTSQDFHIDLSVSRNGILRKYEAVIRRGQDRFDTLFWREVAR